MYGSAFLGTDEAIFFVKEDGEHPSTYLLPAVFLSYVHGSSNQVALSPASMRGMDGSQGSANAANKDGP